MLKKKNCIVIFSLFDVLEEIDQEVTTFMAKKSDDMRKIVVDTENVNSKGSNKNRNVSGQSQNPSRKRQNDANSRWQSRM